MIVPPPSGVAGDPNRHKPTSKHLERHRIPIVARSQGWAQTKAQRHIELAKKTKKMRPQSNISNPAFRGTVRVRVSIEDVLSFHDVIFGPFQ